MTKKIERQGKEVRAMYLPRGDFARDKEQVMRRERAKTISRQKRWSN